jgi:hypothetical protein
MVVTAADASGPRWAWMGLALICLLVTFPAPTTSPDTPGLFTLHEGIWGICPGHGGGRLLRRRCSTSFVWLDCHWRGVAAGENRARLLSWWTMSALARRYLIEGIINAAFTSLVLLQGKPQIWFLGSDDGDARRRSPLRASFWSRCCLEVVLRWSRYG